MVAVVVVVVAVVVVVVVAVVVLVAAAAAVVVVAVVVDTLFFSWWLPLLVVVVVIHVVVVGMVAAAVDCHCCRCSCHCCCLSGNVGVVGIHWKCISRNDCMRLLVWPILEMLHDSTYHMTYLGYQGHAGLSSTVSGLMLRRRILAFDSRMPCNMDTPTLPSKYGLLAGCTNPEKPQKCSCCALSESR